MLGVRVRSPIRERRRVHQPRNRGPAPAGARNARSNRPGSLRGGRTRRHERMDVKDGINLGCGHIRPAEAGRRHAQLHRREYEAPLVAHRFRRLLAAPNDASFIAGAALARFAASGGDKAGRCAVFARHGVAEGVERRRSGRVDFRADIRAGDRVDLVAEDPPGSQPLNGMPSVIPSAKYS
jgi:hypothetical protein